jgi:membrane-bound ClpP family serine protease
MLIVFSSLNVAAIGDQRAILVQISSKIDHRVSDLIEDAMEQMEEENLSTLLIKIDSDSGYLYPTTRIIERLASSRTRVIVYIGPEAAAAFSYSALLAMASNVLIMNDETWIGKAGPGDTSVASLNYLMELMRNLAKNKGRNALAAERMVTQNTEYSADEAFSKGICDLRVKSFQAFLAACNLSQQNIIEKKQSSELSMNRESGYKLLKFFADPTTMKYMFLLLTGLILFKLVYTVARPRRRKKVDETYQTLLDLMKMEIQDLARLNSGGSSVLYETSLHTSADMHMPSRIENKKTVPQLSGRRRKP